MYLAKEKLIKITMMGVILCCSVFTLWLILFGVKQFQLGSQLASMNQVVNLSHLLVRQQANLFSLTLAKNGKAEQLREYLDEFAQQDFVLDASVYAANGELLATSRDAQKLRVTLGLEGKSGEEATQQIVEPIYSANGVEGFLRVTFDTQYGTQTQSKINQLFHQLYGELIIVFLVGMLLASSMHYFISHYRRTYRKPKEKPSPPAPFISPSLQYHRRKRRR